MKNQNCYYLGGMTHILIHHFMFNLEIDKILKESTLHLVIWFFLFVKSLEAFQGIGIVTISIGTDLATVNNENILTTNSFVLTPILYRQNKNSGSSNNNLYAAI